MEKITSVAFREQTGEVEVNGNWSLVDDNFFIRYNGDVFYFYAWRDAKGWCGGFLKLNAPETKIALTKGENTFNLLKYRALKAAEGYDVYKANCRSILREAIK